jgi:hypothetical protein
MLSRRGAAAGLVPVLAAGALTGCLRPGSAGSSGCPPMPAVSRATVRPEPATAERPPPVPETLWVADTAGTLHVFDGRTNRATGEVRLATRPRVFTALSAGGGVIWAYQFDSGLAIVDPATARLTRRVPLSPAFPLAKNHIRYALGAWWLAQPGQVWRIGGPSAEPSRTALPDGFEPTAVAATAHWVWLAGDRRLIRIDPASGAVSTTVDLPVRAGIGSLLGTPNGLFAVGWNQPAVWVLDPDSGGLSAGVQGPRRQLVTGLYGDEKAVWAAGNCGDLLRIRPGGVASVRLAADPVDSAATALGALWAFDGDHGSLARIDSATGTMVARIPVPGVEFAVVPGQHGVWLVDTGLAGDVLRVDPAINRAWRIGAVAPAGMSAAVTIPVPSVS